MYNQNCQEEKRGEMPENREKRQRQAGLNYEIHSLAKKSAIAREKRWAVAVGRRGVVILGKTLKVFAGLQIFLLTGTAATQTTTIAGN